MEHGPGSVLDRLPLLIAVAIGAGLPGCKAACDNSDKQFAYVGKAQLTECYQVVDAEPGETVVVMPEDASTTLPRAPVVRLAADRRVPWAKMAALLDQLEAQGSRPVLLVARGVSNQIGAFVLSDKTDDNDQAISVTATSDGKACVAPKLATEAKCSQSYGKQHIDRAGVRELVREAKTGTGYHDVEVHADPTLDWADVVRAIDGARTCCGKDITMNVKLVRH